MPNHAYSFKPSSKNSIKTDFSSNKNNKPESLPKSLSAMSKSDPKSYNANSIKNESSSNKNDKLESLPKSPSTMSKSDTKPWIKLELLLFNSSEPCNSNSAKNNKLDSLPKSPSATSKLKVLPDAKALVPIPSSFSPLKPRCLDVVHARHALDSHDAVRGMLASIRYNRDRMSFG